MRRLGPEPVSQLQYAALGRSELIDGGQQPAAVGLGHRLVLGGRGGRGEQVAELRVAVVGDLRVERCGPAAGAAQALDLVELPAELGRQLVVARCRAEPRHQRALGDLELSHAIGDRDRQPYDPALVRERAPDRLSDPQRRVRREAEAAAVVELLDGAHEADRALLDQVLHRQRRVLALVALGDVDDEPQVGLDHVVLGREVAALHAARERLLLGGRE
jgi:hypothetical protein